MANVKWQRKGAVPTCVTAPCPFCDGEYTLDSEFPFEVEPGVFESTAAALHTLPFCDEFLASEDALDFARMARERRAEQAVEESN
jgi:hypothetical protein